MRNPLVELFKVKKEPSLKKRIRLLMIEDDESLVELLKELFAQAGYEYTVLTNTDDILPVMADKKPDIVLLDYLLPHINGGELCSQVKNDRNYCNTPVIIFSAFPKVLMSLGTYGCDAFIEKPFDLNYLTRKIERLARRNNLMVQIKLSGPHHFMCREEIVQKMIRDKTMNFCHLYGKNFTKSEIFSGAGTVYKIGILLDKMFMNRLFMSLIN